MLNTWNPKVGDLVAIVGSAQPLFGRSVRFRKVERVTDASAWVDGKRYSRPRSQWAKDSTSWHQAGTDGYYGDSMCMITPELRAERQANIDRAELAQLKRTLIDMVQKADDVVKVRNALQCLSVTPDVNA